MNQEEIFWTKRYEEDKTGWDIGAPSTPLKTYLDQLEDKSIQLLIPGAGNAYEAEYAWKEGFQNVHILDISKKPLEAFQKRNPDFPKNQLHHDNFFSFSGTYDLILEQTFFCSFLPSTENRQAYAQKISELLVPGGKLVGVLFSIPLVQDTDKRPFGGSKTEYESYFKPIFSDVSIENCYNSIPPRMGNELFIQCVK